MPQGMLQLSGQKAYRNALCTHNEYLKNFATFPIYGTNTKQMSEIRDELLKHPSINRILKTNKTDENGRWLVETTRVKLTQAQKKVDMQLESYIAFNTKCTSSRINPSLADEDIVKLTQNLSEVYDNIHQENQEQYHHPPSAQPRMVSYNLHQQYQKPTYSQVASHNKKSEEQIIEPTFTEIDWKSQMEQMQKDTIEKCRKMTENMIKEAQSSFSMELKNAIEKQNRTQQEQREEINSNFSMLFKLLKDDKAKHISDANTSPAKATQLMSLRPQSPLIDKRKQDFMTQETPQKKLSLHKSSTKSKLENNNEPKNGY